MAKSQAQKVSISPVGETPLPATQTAKIHTQATEPFAPVSVVTPPSTPPTAPKKKHGCLGCCLVIVIALIMSGIAAVGLFFAYRSGYINTFQIENALGIGYGEVSVMDMRDGPLTAQIIPFDRDNSEVFDDVLDLKKYEISSFRALNPGSYTIEFADANGYSLGDCTLAIKSGDLYQFFAVPSGIAVLRTGYDPTTPEELNILTSSICQQ